MLNISPNRGAYYHLFLWTNWRDMESKFEPSVFQPHLPCDFIHDSKKISVFEPFWMLILLCTIKYYKWIIFFCFVRCNAFEQYTNFFYGDVMFKWCHPLNKYGHVYRSWLFSLCAHIFNEYTSYTRCTHYIHDHILYTWYIRFIAWSGHHHFNV